MPQTVAGVAVFTDTQRSPRAASEPIPEGNKSRQNGLFHFGYNEGFRLITFARNARALYHKRLHSTIYSPLQVARLAQPWLSNIRPKML